MRYVPFAFAFAVLIPPVIHAQNAQFAGCRTLETTGNFVGPDEALVNGMVCKVVKPKGSPSVPTENEKRMALLGIIEPETLRSKPKPDANPPVGVPTPSDAHAPTNSGLDTTPQTPRFEMIPEGSLANVARAYRTSSRTPEAIAPEVGVVRNEPTAKAKPTTLSPPTPQEMSRTLPSQPNTNTGVVTTGKMPEAKSKPEVPSATTAPVSVTGTGRRQPSKTELLEAPHPLPSEVKPGEIRGTEASASVIPAKPLDGAKTEVLAAPETLSQVKSEPNLPAMGATSTMSPAPQADKNTDVFATTQTPPAQGQPKGSATAANAAADATLPDQQQTVKLGGFVTPQKLPLEMNSASQSDTYGSAQEDVFNDGQHTGCAKNVSLGSLDKERLFLTIPDWATTWYEKNQKRFQGICFSNSPMRGAQNYLIVFFTSVGPPPGSNLLAKISPSADSTPVSGVGNFTTNYGPTWHYTYERTVTTTVTTLSAEKVPHNLPSTVLYATAYSEQGIPISQHWPTATESRNRETVRKARKKSRCVASRSSYRNQIAG